MRRFFDLGGFYMDGSYVMVPDRLRRDPRVTPLALALWMHIRARTHNLKRLCYESGESIGMHMEHRPAVSTAHGQSSGFKRVQRELLDAGYLVNKRRPGTTTLRWAILPGADGERELQTLVEKGHILPVDARLALERQRDTTFAVGRRKTRGRAIGDPASGRTRPAIQDLGEAREEDSNKLHSITGESAGMQERDDTDRVLAVE